MSEGDPTDHALAVIASILDKSETSDVSDAAHETASSEQPEFLLAEEILTIPPAAEADGYVKFGPGPLAAIRFKWAVRSGDNDDYFVDETIGENSHPITAGPMTREAAIEFVDDHERLARERFEALRREMAGGEVGGGRNERS